MMSAPTAALPFLLQFLLALILLAVAIGMNLDFLRGFYLENQQTRTGIILNSAIVGLLAIGLLNLLWLLLRYRREEAAIAGFVENIEAIRPDPTEGLDPHSLIAKSTTMRWRRCSPPMRAPASAWCVSSTTF